MCSRALLHNPDVQIKHFNTWVKPGYTFWFIIATINWDFAGHLHSNPCHFLIGQNSICITPCSQWMFFTLPLNCTMFSPLWGLLKGLLEVRFLDKVSMRLSTRSKKSVSPDPILCEITLTNAISQQVVDSRLKQQLNAGDCCGTLQPVELLTCTLALAFMANVIPPALVII